MKVELVSTERLPKVPPPMDAAYLKFLISRVKSGQAKYESAVMGAMARGLSRIRAEELLEEVKPK